jgi:hypothetical protein
MKRENRTVLRVVFWVLAMLLLSVWVMPAHACAETKHGAAIHCAEVEEFETSALLVQEGALIVGPQFQSCSLSHLTLIPQLSVFTIYRPPQA